MTTKEIRNLEKLLAKIRPGPYEYWDIKDNDLLMSQVRGDQGVCIASLSGFRSMPNEFRAIAALLNAAPELIRLAKKSL